MAGRTEISSELNALAVHCPPRLMEVEARSLWLRDWCDDLAQYPIEAVRMACRRYRHSGATKFPTPGQLLPLVKASIPDEVEKGLNEAWRTLTEAEYEALSIRDKIRHQLIMAAEASRKAGPMFRNTSSGVMARASGYHIPPEEMPDTWRRWTDIAAGHRAEATRLRQYTRSAPTPNRSAQQ